MNLVDTECTPCPPGTYSDGYGANGTCTTCPPGQNSFAGSSSCYLDGINNGQLFAIQSLSTNQILKVDVNSLGLVQECSSALTDPFSLFTYSPTTMQIYNPYTKLCLDDLGQSLTTTPSTSSNFLFKPCSTSTTQQFAYFPSTKYISNPKNPYDKCLDGNIQYPAIFLWQCPYGGLNHQWNILPLCMLGKSE